MSDRHIDLVMHSLVGSILGDTSSCCTSGPTTPSMQAPLNQGSPQHVLSKHTSEQLAVPLSDPQPPATAFNPATLKLNTDKP